jgi:hypothetical protein
MTTFVFTHEAENAKYYQAIDGTDNPETIIKTYGSNHWLLSLKHYDSEGVMTRNYRQPGKAYSQFSCQLTGKRGKINNIIKKEDWVFITGDRPKAAP